MSLSTPVALIIFNRPEYTRRVFREIAAARPGRLLVVGDGPRGAEDEERCRAARKVIEEVDWPCEVSTRYADVNLGCGPGPATGLDWVFSQVEEAIILEDDCVPAPSFFAFCEALLERYRDEPEVMHIGGACFQPATRRSAYSYYFSKYPHIWGWATWRRAWRHYDFEMRQWPAFRKANRLAEVCADRAERRYWRRIYDGKNRGWHNTWDAQWQLACWDQGGRAVVPAANLVSNIGFGSDATHTIGQSYLADLPTTDIWTLAHPPDREIDREADAFTFEHVFAGPERAGRIGPLSRARMKLGKLRRSALARLRRA